MKTDLKNIVEDAVTKLNGVSDALASRKPSPDKWSAKEILGHLIDSASVNLERILRVSMQSGLDLHVYSQDNWVRLQGYQERSFGEILTLWHSLNVHIAFLLERLPDESLVHTFNVPHAQNVTLQFLIEDYVAHLQHHLKQVWERVA